MQISITPEIERYIHAQLEGGAYESVSDLVQEAIQLLITQDQFRQRRIQAMDRFIGEGIADADAGNLGTPTELMAEMDTLFTELRQPRG